MEDSSSSMLGPRLNFKFAFNDTDFSDRVLRIEFISDSLGSKSESEGCDFVPNIEKLVKENGWLNVYYVIRYDASTFMSCD